MKITLLGAPSGWYVQQLVRSALPGDQVQVMPFGQLAAQVAMRQSPVSVGQEGCELGDALVVRSMPTGSLEQVVFRMNILYACLDEGRMVVNPPAALEAAIDKYLCLVRLARAGLPVPPTAVCQTVEQAMAAYEELGPEVILKPLLGSEGRGMTRVSDAGLVERAAVLLSRLGGVMYMQRFIPHGGRDWRMLVIGPDVLAIERRNPGQWRTNLRQGGRPVPLELPPSWQDVAQRAAAAVGARWAGVDILPGPQGEWYVLEVNAVPGWRGLAEATQVDVPRLCWHDLHRAVRER